MDSHLDVDGLIDLVAGACFIALAVLLSVGVLHLAPRFNDAPLWSTDDEIVVRVVVLFVSAVFVALGIPSLIAGVALLKRKG